VVAGAVTVIVVVVPGEHDATARATSTSTVSSDRTLKVRPGALDLFFNSCLPICFDIGARRPAKQS
jgi:hypothetical protein